MPFFIFSISLTVSYGKVSSFYKNGHCSSTKYFSLLPLSNCAFTARFFSRAYSIASIKALIETPPYLRYLEKRKDMVAGMSWGLSLPGKQGCRRTSSPPPLVGRRKRSAFVRKGQLFPIKYPEILLHKTAVDLLAPFNEQHSNTALDVLWQQPWKNFFALSCQLKEVSLLSSWTPCRNRSCRQRKA